MKKIIDGKRYNTQTAKQVAGWSNDLGYSDFDHIEEALYHTKNGNWFLYGRGGPKTKYFRFAPGGNKSSGEDIIPLYPNEALMWLEKHEFTDELEEWFSDNIKEA